MRQLPPTAALLVALALGALLPVQVAVNARLRAALGQPVVAAAVSFAVGTLALVLLLLVAVRPAAASLLPGVARLPWWGWTGGVLGAAYILGTILLAPRLGAAALVGGIIAGQLVAAIAVDHFGLLGFARQPVTPARAAGAALLALGVYLVQRR